MTQKINAHLSYRCQSTNEELLMKSSYCTKFALVCPYVSNGFLIQGELFKVRIIKSSNMNQQYYLKTRIARYIKWDLLFSTRRECQHIFTFLNLSVTVHLIFLQSRYISCLCPALNTILKELIVIENVWMDG